MKKKVTILTIFLIIIIIIWHVTPTFAIFSNNYTTDEDVVGLDLNFDLKISNIEEYEELRISANSYEIYNVIVSNGTSDKLYYGIWYKMAIPTEKNDDIMINKLEDNRTTTSGELEWNEEKTISIIIKNNTSSDIVINIGVATSEESTENIEYLGGKHLITGAAKEVDYYYDQNSKKYISTTDSNTYFLTNPRVFNESGSEIILTTPDTIVYQIEAWGAKKQENNGAYTKGLMKLTSTDKLYLHIGKKDENNQTEIRLIPEETSEELSKQSAIMIAGTDKTDSYISGHLGIIAENLDEELKEKCKTGLEDIACSYHTSKKHFKNTKLTPGTEDMISPDGKETMKGNKENGFIKVTPIVPTIELPSNKIKKGEKIYDYDIICHDNGNGCNVVKLLPNDTSTLDIGTTTISVIVIDDDGITYRYTENLEITE